MPVWLTLQIVPLLCHSAPVTPPENIYLGERPPGDTPKVFGKGVISTDANIEFGITISPDGKEIFFTRRPKGKGKKNRLLCLRFEKGRWTNPMAPVFASDHGEKETNFSPDGEEIYFHSGRPQPSGVSTGHAFNTWIVRRSPTGWDTPKVLGRPVSDVLPMFVTETESGTIYMTGNTVRGIYSSEFRDGAFQDPVYLPETVNAKRAAGHPYIAPDERYLLFDSNMDAQGNKNLFISFRKHDGQWGKAVNVSKSLGLPRDSWCPFVTFDGEHFFFCAFGDIYWMNAESLWRLGGQEEVQAQWP